MQRFTLHSATLATKSMTGYSKTLHPVSSSSSASLVDQFVGLSFGRSITWSFGWDLGRL